MRIKTKVNAKVWADSLGKDKLLDLDDTACEQTLDAPQEASCGHAVIPATEAFDVPLGKVGTPTGVFLRASKDCSVVLNGGTAMALKVPQKTAGAVMADYAHFFFTGTITSIEVTAGASDVTLTYAVYGDNAA